MVTWVKAYGPGLAPGQTKSDYMLQNFYIRGDEVYGMDGKPVERFLHNHTCWRVILDEEHCRSGFVRQNTVAYHRMKFLVAYGWMPSRIIHLDGNTLNNKLLNLVAGGKRTAS